MSYFAMKAYFAAIELAEAQHKLAQAIRWKLSSATVLTLMTEHDRIAVEAREFNRIAVSRLRHEEFYENMSRTKNPTF